MKLTRATRRTQSASMRFVQRPKARADHYGTAAHLEWAQAVITRANGQCQGCNAKGTRLYADHIKEIRDGGESLDLNNGQALCAKCHGQKTQQARKARLT